MANIAGEIDGKMIRNTADLKDITGGDTMEIEPKGGESFSDTMNTTLMFAANDPPIIGNRDKGAIATRIVPVELPYRFTSDPSGPMEKKKVPESVLEEELATPEAMSALLELALDGIERLENNEGDVSLPESPKERLALYEGEADPMKKFGQTCLTSHPSDYVVKADVTRIYEEWAEENGHETGQNVHSALHGALEFQDAQPRNPDYSGTSLPLRPWEERQRVLSRVTLTEEGLLYAEKAGLVVEEEEEENTTRGLAALSRGEQGTIKARIGGFIKPKSWLAAEGWLEDETPFKPNFEVREELDGSNPMEGVKKGDLVTIHGAEVKTDDDVRYVEIGPKCSVEIVEEADTGPDPDAHHSDAQAAADGGEETEEGTSEPEAAEDEEPAEDADTDGEYEDWRVDLADAYRATSDGDGADKGKLKVALADRGREFDAAHRIVEDVARKKGFVEDEDDRVRATEELEKML
jgi:putative DNA primase/helicase